MLLYSTHSVYMREHCLNSNPCFQCSVYNWGFLMKLVLKSAVSWGVSPCSLTEPYQYLEGCCCYRLQGEIGSLLYPGDRGGRIAWIAGNRPPDYTVTYRGRLPRSPWQPKIPQICTNHVLGIFKL
jgi:hypothetical protein